jgi:hypothetical protein
VNDKPVEKRAPKSRGTLFRFSRREVLAAIDEYEMLLDSKASERTIHRFLASHIYFWNGMLRLLGGCPLYSKVKLGAQYEVDFVFCDTSSNGAEWHLVEIEPPKYRLFNSKGDPSHHLTHALAQIRSYQRWIERNHEFAESLMPGIDRPMGHVFVGRRSEVATAEARERLRALNIESRASVEIHTLDRFSRMAQSALTLGTSRLPPQALTDRDLRKGLAPWLVDFIRSDFGQQRLFIGVRRRRRHFDEDTPDRHVSMIRVGELTGVNPRPSRSSAPRPVRERPPAREPRKR